MLIYTLEKMLTLMHGPLYLTINKRKPCPIANVHVAFSGRFGGITRFLVVYAWHGCDLFL